MAVLCSLWLTLAVYSPVEAQGVRRDSAAIAISDNAALQSEPLRLQSRPLWEVRVAPSARFGWGVEPFHAARLADGTVLFVVGGGEFFRWRPGLSAEIQRLGRLPEVGTPRSIRRVHDSLILVHYSIPDRIYYVDSALRVVQQHRAEEYRTDRYGDRPLPVFPDGSVLIQSTHYNNRTRMDTAARDTVDVHRLDRYGMPGRPFLRLASGESRTFALSTAAGTVVLPGQRVAFARNLTLRVHGEAIFAGDGARYEVSVYDSTGALTRVIRSHRADRPVTSSDSAFASSGRGELGDSLLRLSPPTLPAFTRFELDPAGRLWVNEGAVNGSETRWTLFDSVGVELGSILVKRSMEVVEFGANDLLIVERAEDGHDWLRIYPLPPPLER